MLKLERKTGRQPRMRNKWFKRLFPVLALLLLAPWPVAYAHTFDGAMAGQDGVQIEVAEAPVQPTWTAFGKAIGGVTPGDLFYIDATDNPADIVATLYITNAQELIGCYRSLILKVGIYTKSAGGEWEKESTGNGELVPDTFITMHNGQVGFTLPGLAKYKVAIDSGSFYCTTTNTDKGSLSPQFYLEMN
jgi:hypothetical protein